MQLFLTISKNKMEIENWSGPRNSEEIIGKVETIEELVYSIECEQIKRGDYSKPEFMCSSSIDFPEEFTQNSKVIDLCREIRE